MVFTTWSDQSSSKFAVPIVAMTATETAETRSTVKQILRMRHPVIVEANPHRPNIKYSVQKIEDDPFVTFKWLDDELKEKTTATPKTIIYCRQVKDCAYIYRVFQMGIPDCIAYHPATSEKVAKNRIFGTFHQSTEKEIKDTVIQSFRKPDGVCRIVIATIALGMGMDFQNIRRVINYGPPNTLEQYSQQRGRAGRDNEQSIAAIYYHGRHLKTCDEALRGYTSQTESCRRELLLGHFGWTKGTPLSPSHLCCDICANSCPCTESHRLLLEQNTIQPSPSSDQELYSPPPPRKTKRGNR